MRYYFMCWLNPHILLYPERGVRRECNEIIETKDDFKGSATYLALEVLKLLPFILTQFH